MRHASADNDDSPLHGGEKVVKPVRNGFQARLIEPTMMQLERSVWRIEICYSFP
jgi:hypothetical protein